MREAIKTPHAFMHTNLSSLPKPTTDYTDSTDNFLPGAAQLDNNAVFIRVYESASGITIRAIRGSKDFSFARNHPISSPGLPNLCGPLCALCNFF